MKLSIGAVTAVAVLATPLVGVAQDASAFIDHMVELCAKAARP